jgi:predicted DNA-binding WGR domain protein
LNSSRERARSFGRSGFPELRFIRATAGSEDQESAAAAKRLHERLVAEKIKKGYEERPTAAKANAPKASKSGVDTKAPSDDLFFEDIGLHMAVAGAAAEVNPAFKKKLQGFFKTLKTKFDIDEEEDEAILDGLAQLHRVGIPRKAAAKIKRLGFDGGAEIYMSFEDAIGGDGFTTGGETDHYDVKSLEGIAALESLEALGLDCYGASVKEKKPLDLKPLGGLLSLSDLVVGGYVKNAKSIARLPLDSLRWDSRTPPNVRIKVRSMKMYNFWELERLEILRGAEITELSLFFSSATPLAETAAILRQIVGLKKLVLGGGFDKALKKAMASTGVDVTTV